MSEEKTIRLSEEAARVLKDLEVPDWMMERIVKSMGRENQFTLAKIQRDHLTGRGPFPPEEHKLGVRTNRLRAAAWASDPEVTGAGQVTSAIGDNVVYAEIHEFGGRIVRQPREGSVRLRTNAAGELLKGPGGRGAIFASKEHKRVRDVKYSSKGYEIDMPERAPFRTGIGERLDAMGRAVSADLVTAWGERK
jgi:hypothetical protein